MSLLRFVSILLVFSTGCGMGFFRGYSCDAPEGVKCQSIHEVYSSKPKATGVKNEIKLEEIKPENTPSSNLRTPEIVQKVWIAEHVTPSGDYQGGSYIYMVIRPSSWRTEEQPPAAPTPYKVIEKKEVALTPPPGSEEGVEIERPEKLDLKAPRIPKIDIPKGK